MVALLEFLLALNIFYQFAVDVENLVVITAANQQGACIAIKLHANAIIIYGLSAAAATLP